MNRDRSVRWLLLTIGCSLLVFSLYILHRELSRYRLTDILASLSAISDRQLYYAFGLTCIGYLIISSYDLIAFHNFNYQLKAKRILLTSFVTYAVSNTTGFTLLIGGGIRYRFYSWWQVPPKLIVKITAFGNITFWLGLLTLCGTVLTFAPQSLLELFKIEIAIFRYLGIAASLLVGIYLYCCWRRQRIRLKGKAIFFPKLKISLWQIAVFTADWALAAAVLYCLLPNYLNKSYPEFFHQYLLAMAAAIVSNVPGGIGVFETIVILSLPSSIATPDILSSLLVYRTIRFLLPLSTAAIVAGIFEWRRRLEKIQK